MSDGAGGFSEGHIMLSESQNVRVVILRAPDRPGLLVCGGRPMIAARPVACSLSARLFRSGRSGRCYYDPVSGLSARYLEGEDELYFEGRQLVAMPSVPRATIQPRGSEAP